MRTLLAVVLVGLVGSSAAEASCPPTVANCDYCQQCVEVMTKSKGADQAVSHCLAFHDRKRVEDTKAGWDRFLNADRPTQEGIVRDMLLKQCTNGGKNSLCP